MSELFEPKNNEENMISIAMDLVMDMQFSIQAAMKKHNINQKKLAEIMGCSASNVSQMLADDANPRVETIAKALAVMGEKFIFVSESLNGQWITVNFKQKGFLINNKDSLAKETKRFIRSFEDVKIISEEKPRKLNLIKACTKKANDNSWLMGSKVKDLSEQFDVAV